MKVIKLFLSLNDEDTFTIVDKISSNLSVDIFIICNYNCKRYLAKMYFNAFVLVSVHGYFCLSHQYLPTIHYNLKTNNSLMQLR